LHEPNYLLSYTHLAHQTYLIDPFSVSILEKLYFEAYRVGHLRSNLAEMEPAIRNADMVSFDITAIKSADAPGNANAQPFGLAGEEACQICWYAGLNEKLSSIGFYEYNPEKDDEHKKTASVVATMIWYFIEGFYHRKNETNFKSNDFLKYVVSKISKSGILYSLLNFAGAGLACLASILLMYWPFIILEGVWMLVSLVSLTTWLRKKAWVQTK
jgi:formiminoglutamase